MRIQVLQRYQIFNFQETKLIVVIQQLNSVHFDQFAPRLFWQLKYYTMSDNEDPLFLHITPTKKRMQNEFRFITSPLQIKQPDLYEELLNLPVEKKISQEERDIFSSAEELSYPLSDSYYSQSRDNEDNGVDQEVEQKSNKNIMPQEVNLETPLKTFKGCHCEKSKCSKKYCDCYKLGKVCSTDCECVGCENHIVTQKHQKLQKIAELTKSGKGKEHRCNCRKSHCLKNYCECHNEGKFCSEACNCIQCDNKLDNNHTHGRKRHQQISMWSLNKQNILFN